MLYILFVMDCGDKLRASFVHVTRHGVLSVPRASTCPIFFFSFLCFFFVFFGNKEPISLPVNATRCCAPDEQALDAAKREKEAAAAEARAVAERAAKAAAEALDLDPEYLARVKEQQEARKRAKASRAGAAGAAGTYKYAAVVGAAAASAPVPAAPPDPKLLAEVGVDDGYMAQLRRQEEERRRLKEAKSAKSAKSAAAAEDFGGDESMAQYASEYRKRAREQTEQRALVAAVRKQHVEAAGLGGGGGGGKGPGGKGGGAGKRKGKRHKR